MRTGGGGNRRGQAVPVGPPAVLLEGRAPGGLGEPAGGPPAPPGANLQLWRGLEQQHRQLRRILRLLRQPVPCAPHHLQRIYLSCQLLHLRTLAALEEP